MEMDWKERRRISRLSAILALLSAAVLIVLGIRYRASRPAEAVNPGQEGDPAVQTDHSALRYSNGSATLSFEMENGVWIWVDEPDFPLDPAAVIEILSTVENLQYQQTLTPEGELSEYGLDVPAAVLTVTAADGTVRTLTLGKTTTDGASDYMMENEDASVLHIIPGTLRRQLETPVYDMMRLPETPDFSEERLKQLTIQSPAPEAAEGETPRPAPTLTVTARWSVLGKLAVWSHEGSNVTDSAALQELVKDLISMALVKCVDYKPSDQAASICGFDAPPAVLTVDYTTESGADASWTLTLGGAAPDGRYARVDGDSTIYLLAADSADALLRLAASGLNG